MDDAPTWSVTEARSLGTALSSPAQQFGLISDVARDTAGRLYVADAQLNRVLVFSSRDSLIRKIGREGEGPGEFAGLLSISLTPDSRLHVFDLNLWRQTVFDPSGGVSRTDNLPQPPQFGQLPAVGHDRQGRLYNLSYGRFASTLKRALQRGATVARGSASIERWSTVDKSWRTLVPVPSVEVYVSGGGLGDAPFAEEPLWDPVPGGGIWYADSGEYLLTRISAAGDTLCRMRVERGAPPVTDDDREAYVTGADLSDISDERRRKIRERRQEMPIPDRRPVLSDLVSTRSGGVWVRPAPRTWGPTAHTVTWHAYSATGELEARVRLPGDVSPVQVDPDRVVGTRRAEAGVDQVVVLETVRDR